MWNFIWNIESHFSPSSQRGKPQVTCWKSQSPLMHLQSWTVSCSRRTADSFQKPFYKEQFMFQKWIFASLSWCWLSDFSFGLIEKPRVSWILFLLRPHGGCWARVCSLRKLAVPRANGTQNSFRLVGRCIEKRLGFRFKSLLCYFLAVWPWESYYILTPHIMWHEDENSSPS